MYMISCLYVVCIDLLYPLRYSIFLDEAFDIKAVIGQNFSLVRAHMSLRMNGSDLRKDNNIPYGFNEMASLDGDYVLLSCDTLSFNFFYSLIHRASLVLIAFNKRYFIICRSLKKTKELLHGSFDLILMLKERRKIKS